jgi:hypothetical protein
MIVIVSGLIVAIVVWVTTVGHSLIVALLAQEVRGALADRLKRDIEDAAETLPGDLRATYASEWLGELDAAKGRPVKAVMIVRGYKKAARGILAAEPALAPNESGPTFVRRLREGTARNVATRAAGIVRRLNSRRPEVRSLESLFAVTVILLGVVLAITGMVVVVGGITLGAIAGLTVVYVGGGWLLLGAMRDRR